MMRAVKLGLVLTVMTTVLSCSAPTSNHNYVYTTKITINGNTSCHMESKRKRLGYRAPPLPDLSNLTDDYEVIDALTAHIHLLHLEIKSLTKEGC